ncbi:DNA-directed RNA polymerase subunit B'' [Candidatus Micrarchaeota archaeon]|nr:DNA-directed RNA polymerase subunit B'' [Candidatus Micrarchaeota archaeon]MBU1165814.1 DNA-directed RNA polymerase subunit B'' [Candidatus Micrarchaeota archaeon]MBU1887509.1 DNA-directed RNA polymerase subunit B'' [Candidatus Micrarchaeota archaeon]
MVDGLIESYFKSNTLVNQQLLSYNKFVDFGIQKVVDRIGKIHTNVEGFELKLGKVRIEQPRYYEVKGGYRQVLPNEARLRNLSYSAPVFLEIIPVFNGVERPVYSDVFIGELPVMLKSKLCYLSNLRKDELIKNGEDPDDPGGYFVINGSERVLVSIEDLVPNKLMITKERNGIVSKIFSTHYGFRARCVVERNVDGFYTAEFPSTPSGTPLIQLLRVLGLEKNEQVLSVFSSDSRVKNDVILNLEGEQSQTREEAVDMLSRRLSPGQPSEFRLNRMENLIDNYLLPHIGVSKSARMDKAHYLIRMAERATGVAYKEAAPDDKDHYANKRVKLAGDLMEELFRYAFQFLIKDLVYQASRADARGRRLQVHTLIRQDVMGDRIKYAMATGNWIAGQTGVSQLLDRVSYVSTISHLRRIISPLSKKHPHFKARDLHGTHIGKLCPNETPEGPSCSLVKNLSVMAEVSIGVEEEELERILKSYDVKIGDV